LTNVGEPSTKEASMAKLYASESAVKIARETLRIFGDNGYDGEYPVERYFRDSKVLTIFEGTSEIQNIIISREMGL
ncbi:MAG: acyl-CoA dehydrogenase, partial [Desulfobacterales bacterium]|nr:acyl-CoA dehydrogenase [Desulfobacterales bacterium]